MRFQRIALLITGAFMSNAHPLCMDSTAPSQEKKDEMQFCIEIKEWSNKDGGCCTREQEENEKIMYFDSHTLSEKCKPYQRQVACGKCHPYSVHLFSDRSGIMRMSKDFCLKYFDACKNDMNLSRDFCDKHTKESYYVYPFELQVPTKGTAKSLEPYFYNLQGRIPTQMTGMYMKPESNSWWIVNQRGQIVEVENKRDASSTNTIMDIKYRVTQGGSNGLGEMGLLGLAFSPDFPSTKNFYVNYISNSRNTVIARYTYKSGDAAGTANTEKILMQFQQPYENHNGGTLLFSPGDLARPSGRPYYDLYIATGDGGGANDPNNRAQDLNTKFGKILRIRISTDYSKSSYDIPDGNIRGEVWAYGLRNPWKCSFDKSKTGSPEMWCGDVGQDKIEKVTRVEGGKNHGWKNFEGTRHNSGGYIDYRKPEYQYCHTGVNDSICNGKPFTGESVTGGFMYRGSQLAGSYGGQYIYADYQRHRVLRMYQKDGQWQSSVIINDSGWIIPSLAEDKNGEIYVLRYGENANVYALPDLNSTEYSSTEGHESSISDPMCQNGFINSKACCPRSCGSCGGNNCHLRPGGSSACCISGVIKSGKLCSTNEAPCILSSAPTSNSDLTCKHGINGGKVCCPKSCGSCGNSNCHLRPGGASACCVSGILNGGKMCSSHIAPCIIHY